MSAVARRRAAPVSGEHAELQRAGAKAAARGEGAGANPMFDAINKPPATGETEEVWSGRRDAWEHGRSTQHGTDPGPGPKPPRP